MNMMKNISNAFKNILLYEEQTDNFQEKIDNLNAWLLSDDGQAASQTAIDAAKARITAYKEALEKQLSSADDSADSAAQTQTQTQTPADQTQTQTTADQTQTQTPPPPPTTTPPTTTPPTTTPPVTTPPATTPPATTPPATTPPATTPATVPNPTADERLGLPDPDEIRAKADEIRAKAIARIQDEIGDLDNVKRLTGQAKEVFTPILKKTIDKARTASEGMPQLAALKKEMQAYKPNIPASPRRNIGNAPKYKKRVNTQGY